MTAKSNKIEIAFFADKAIFYCDCGEGVMLRESGNTYNGNCNRCKKRYVVGRKNGMLFIESHDKESIEILTSKHNESIH